MLRTLGLLAVCAAALPLAPAHAGIGVGGAGWTSTGDAKVCFTVRLTGIVAGTATASGAVHTGPVVPPNPVTPFVVQTLQDNGIHPTVSVVTPNTAVADVRPLVTTSGYSSVCVGGTGVAADGGAVLFTLDAHSLAADYVVEVHCSYDQFGAHCT
jgi:hypothetical protein